jgi:hypothetical protein
MRAGLMHKIFWSVVVLVFSFCVVVSPESVFAADKEPEGQGACQEAL